MCLYDEEHGHLVPWTELFPAWMTLTVRRGGNDGIGLDGIEIVLTGISISLAGNPGRPSAATGSCPTVRVSTWRDEEDGEAHESTTLLRAESIVICAGQSRCMSANLKADVW